MSPNNASDLKKWTLDVEASQDIGVAQDVVGNKDFFQLAELGNEQTLSVFKGAMNSFT